MLKVIFHIDEIAKADLTLRNIGNILANLGEDNLKVELLANSDGVKLFIKPATQYVQLLTELATQGVIFNVCANTLNELGLSKESLLDLTTIVPSGIVELIKKQEIGYAYIKP